jgi:hypothetical protein
VEPSTSLKRCVYYNTFLHRKGDIPKGTFGTASLELKKVHLENSQGEGLN